MFVQTIFRQINDPFLSCIGGLHGIHIKYINYFLTPYITINHMKPIKTNMYI